MARAAWKVWGRRGLLLLALLLALALLGGWLFLRASLPRLDGEVRSPLLEGRVSVARDANGVPTISGASRLDLAYATGFVHGQERFFQMDLLRRSAAGELAELFGPKALPLDRAHRLHRFRALAAGILARLAPHERLFVERYAAGVNDGLNALGARPFEYALTGAAPRPWSAADSMLVVWAMYFDLQGNQEGRELARDWLARHATAEQLAFLLPEGSGWDAPLDAPALAAAPAPIPAAAPAWWGRQEALPPRQVAGLDYVDAVGSNNYALAGARTASGRRSSRTTCTSACNCRTSGTGWRCASRTRAAPSGAWSASASRARRRWSSSAATGRWPGPSPTAMPIRSTWSGCRPTARMPARCVPRPVGKPRPRRSRRSW